jgi:hypothetical protein
MVNCDTIPVVPLIEEVHNDTNLFVQKLRELEANAKIEMAKWDPAFLGPNQEGIQPQSLAGTKRKGTTS